MAESVHTMESDGVSQPEEDTEMEISHAPGGEDADNGDLKEGGQNITEVTTDPFKKPAIFAAPSIAGKRSGRESDQPVSTDRPPNAESDTLTPKRGSDGPSESPEKRSAKETRSHTKQNQDKQIKVPPAGKFPPLPYSEPPWAGVADVPYSFELLKNGAIVDTVPLTLQSYFVVGRLPICDISLEHPSISRYHAVVQYRGDSGDQGVMGDEVGFYVYDLGSTHGTFVNKNKIPPQTYIRVRVGHVLKFGGSTRLFILQGPEFDEEAESELTVTELRERARKQREVLEKKMMGNGSDDDDNDGDDDEKEKNGDGGSSGRKSSEDTGCSWGMEEEAEPVEDENEENPFATEFHEDQEAAYLKDPKKALQGFYDREGEELEFEYEDKGHGTWLCRIKLPVDDASGRQLVAEVTHPGKKKEAAVQCCLEACRMLEARGVLRQEAVSRKRKKKNWEENDYYDSDDDSFLDRTGTVEKKRTERMKKAGKIQERPDTYDSLVAKLATVEKQLADTESKLRSSEEGGATSSAADPLDVFMSRVRGQAALDGVERKKMHVHVAELKKEAQRLRELVEVTRPTQLPSLLGGPDGLSSDKPKKIPLPLFGAMKGGSKFKLKTGAIGKLPSRRPNLPPELFNMKELPPGGEEEEEEDDEEKQGQESKAERDGPAEVPDVQSDDASGSGPQAEDACSHSPKDSDRRTVKKASSHGRETAKSLHPKEDSSSLPRESPKKSGKKMTGPGRPPSLSKQYPEDDPDYCVWIPPAGQTGDGRTHLNDKYGY
ncbi:kanadaptin isoform X2 [Brachyhypopomus gauderio]|uniref:kanadaptin isoform X2 n=1 Tax=Brachyhypopomus gauderio TaxID=698409 RepID=UPI004040EBC3